MSSSQSEQALSQPRVRAMQLALFDEDFDLDDEQRAFAHRYVVTGGDGADAVLSVRPSLSQDSARRTAARWLDPTSKKTAELLRYIAWCRAQARLKAELTEVELIAATRRILAHAMGDEPIAKTIVFKDGGTADKFVREPSLTAANAAVELLRKIGGIGKDLGAGQATAVNLSFNLAGESVESRDNG